MSKHAMLCHNLTSEQGLKKGLFRLGELAGQKKASYTWLVQQSYLNAEMSKHGISWHDLTSDI